MTPVTVSQEALNKLRAERESALAQVKELTGKLEAAELRIKELEAKSARKKPATTEAQ